MYECDKDGEEDGKKKAEQEMLNSIQKGLVRSAVFSLSLLPLLCGVCPCALLYLCSLDTNSSVALNHDERRECGFPA
jgi:hypothetical protein